MDDIEKILKEQLKSADNIIIEETVYGTKIKITSLITGPDGQVGKITSIWMKDSEEIVRFITSIPEPMVI